MKKVLTKLILQFQPTPPRGERLSQSSLCLNSGIISTHAPARGATALIHASFGISVISTHAPARGATVPHGAVFFFQGNFNPRPREGSDTIPDYFHYSASHFNPRPREGSDQKPEYMEYGTRYFNPRPREGSDAGTAINPRVMVFQPTPPRGERRSLYNVENKSL